MLVVGIQYDFTKLAEILISHTHGIAEQYFPVVCIRIPNQFFQYLTGGKTPAMDVQARQLERCRANRLVTTGIPIRDLTDSIRIHPTMCVPWVDGGK